MYCSIFVINVMMFHHFNSKLYGFTKLMGDQVELIMIASSTDLKAVQEVLNEVKEEQARRTNSINSITYALCM